MQLHPANLARATIEGVLWSLAYSLQTLQRYVAGINRITLTGGAAQSRAVREIARAVFVLLVTTTEPFESVAVGAARQAAWALTGTLPAWPVPYIDEQEPSMADVAAAAEINERYHTTLHAHYDPATAL